LSEFEAENPFPTDAFSKKIFREEENFPTGNYLWGGVVAPCHLSTTPLTALITIKIKEEFKRL